MNISSTINLPTVQNAQLSNPVFYSGDFNLFSGHGMIYSGDLDFNFRAPASTFAATFYKGTLNIGQLSDGITLAQMISQG